MKVASAGSGRGQDSLSSVQPGMRQCDIGLYPNVSKRLGNDMLIC